MYRFTVIVPVSLFTFSFCIADLPSGVIFLPLLEEYHLEVSGGFFEFLNFILFFIQQVLIIHPLYTHQCIHVNPNRPIHPPHPTPRCFPPLVSICLFSTSVSLFLPCKPVHLYHFSRFHTYVNTRYLFSLSDLLHCV